MAVELSGSLIRRVCKRGNGTLWRVLVPTSAGGVHHAAIVGHLGSRRVLQAQRVHRDRGKVVQVLRNLNERIMSCHKTASGDGHVGIGSMLRISVTDWSHVNGWCVHVLHLAVESCKLRSVERRVELGNLWKLGREHIGSLSLTIDHSAMAVIQRWLGHVG